MISISPKQVDSFAAKRRRSVARQMAERMILRHPDAVDGRSVEELTKAFDPELRRAHAHGMRSMAMLERWCDIAALVAFGFSNSAPWAKRTLAREDLSPHAKLDKIEGASVFALRAAQP